MDQHGNTIEIIAQRVGVNEPALRLMIGLMIGKSCPDLRNYLNCYVLFLYEFGATLIW